MNRTEFISMLGLGAVASVVPISGKEESKEVIKSENGKDYEELYEIFQERKPIKIGGIEFMLTDMEIDHLRGQSISLRMISTGAIDEDYL